MPCFRLEATKSRNLRNCRLKKRLPAKNARQRFSPRCGGVFEDVALLAATVKFFLQESLECLGSRDIHVVGLSFVTPGKNNAKENGRHQFFKPELVWLNALLYVLF